MNKDYYFMGQLDQTEHTGKTPYTSYIVFSTIVK